MSFISSFCFSDSVDKSLPSSVTGGRLLMWWESCTSDSSFSLPLMPPWKPESRGVAAAVHTSATHWAMLLSFLLFMIFSCTSFLNAVYSADVAFLGREVTDHPSFLLRRFISLSSRLLVSSPGIFNFLTFLKTLDEWSRDLKIYFWVLEKWGWNNTLVGCCCCRHGTVFPALEAL